MADPTIPSEAEQEQRRQAGLQQAAQGGLDDIPNMRVFARKRPVGSSLYPVQPRETATTPRRAGGQEFGGGNIPTPKAEDYNDYIKVSDYANQYYTFTPEERQSFLANIEKLGGDTTKMKDQDLFKIWQEYVVQAAMRTRQGQDANPWDVMGMDISSQEAVRKAQLQKPNEFLTATQSQTKLSTAADAKAILYQASRTLLGRAPTEAESSSFFADLNAEESANPEMTTTTTERTAAGDVVSQNSVSSGGLSADAKQLMTLEAAKKNPEYGAYQAATTFKDALMSKVYGKGY